MRAICRFFRIFVMVIISSFFHMPTLNPEEMLRIVSADLKINHLSHAEAAILLKMRSKQTLSNLLSSKRYMSEMNANRFNEAFGYSKEFLMYGTGSLFDSEPNQEDHMSPIARLLDVFPKGKVQRIGGRIHDIEGINKGDLEQVLNWFRDAFSFHGDLYYLALWAEIARYVDATAIIAKRLNDYYHGDYHEVFRTRFDQFRSESAERIEKMIISKKF